MSANESHPKVTPKDCEILAILQERQALLSQTENLIAEIEDASPNSPATDTPNNH